MSINLAAPQWKAAVQRVTDMAHAKLPPEWHSRLEMATAICLHGMIDFDQEGVCHVLSSDRTTWYEVNGVCQCEAGSYHPGEDFWCKHRIARGLALRAHALVTTPTASATAAPETTTEPSQDADAPTIRKEGKNGGSSPALPEAPARVNCHITVAGRQVQLTLRDTDERRLLARLAEVLKDYPTEQTPLVQTPTHAQPQPPPVCQYHGPMKPSTKATNSWYCPAKMGDNSYCKERQ